MNKRAANALIEETSPYLKQHAYNPVHWKAWSEKTLQQAKKDGKPLIVSIGYSACHWCHVMERECFEDREAAEIMNKHFTCIKVDREEHPDVDHLYMDAVQLLTRSGGWPLNCFALPDGRPFYGGTYFPREAWIEVLKKVANEYENNRDELIAFAEKLTEGISVSGIGFIRREGSTAFGSEQLETAVGRLKGQFDRRFGGLKGAPKFPTPVIIRFLLDYGNLTGDIEVLKHVKLTLSEQARGGVYDQIGGGFARYSTDEKWSTPHFEKMLYDNAQLISLYTAGYRRFGEDEFAETARQTIEFAHREMRDPDTGAFYSALDADSEGEEGRFYTWTENELEKAAGDLSSFALDYFSIGPDTLFENGRHILLRTGSDREFIEQNGMTKKEFEHHKKALYKRLMQTRSGRVRPGLDDKVLTSWNALMCRAMSEASIAFESDEYLNSARKTADFLISRIAEDGTLYRTVQNGKPRIKGYLEDYALTALALLSLNAACGDDTYIRRALSLIDVMFKRFFDSRSGMFYFSERGANKVPVRKIETLDSVMPSSNSAAAHALFTAGKLTGDTDLITAAENMAENMTENLVKFPASHAEWGTLALHITEPFREVAVTGEGAVDFIRNMTRDEYLSNVWFAATKKPSNLSLFKDRFIPNQTTCYVCENNACQIPVTEPSKALEQLR